MTSGLAVALYSTENLANRSGSCAKRSLRTRLLGLSDAWMAWSFFQAWYSVGCELDMCVGLGWRGRRTRGESSAHDYQCHDERDLNYVISPSKCVSHIAVFGEHSVKCLKDCLRCGCCEPRTGLSCNLATAQFRSVVTKCRTPHYHARCTLFSLVI